MLNTSARDSSLCVQIVKAFTIICALGQPKWYNLKLQPSASLSKPVFVLDLIQIQIFFLSFNILVLARCPGTVYGVP